MLYVYTSRRWGVSTLFIMYYTYNIITFLNQQLENLKRPHIKIELIMLKFVTLNILQLQHQYLQLQR
jgi:hypothetical protein